MHTPNLIQHGNHIKRELDLMRKKIELLEVIVENQQIWHNQYKNRMVQSIIEAKADLSLNINRTKLQDNSDSLTGYLAGLECGLAALDSIPIIR